MEKVKIQEKLQRVLSPKRYAHTLGVMATAASLAELHGASVEKAALAGLLHDCAREIRGEELFHMCKEQGIPLDPVTVAQPELLHGPLGAKLAEQEYGVADQEVLAAIRSHTIGREGMSLLEKIVFVADYVEPGREFPGVEDIRQLTHEDMDRAMILAIDTTLGYVMRQGKLIHPQAVTARNELVLKKLGEGSLSD